MQVNVSHAAVSLRRTLTRCRAWSVQVHAGQRNGVMERNTCAETSYNSQQRNALLYPSETLSAHGYPHPLLASCLACCALWCRMTWMTLWRRSGSTQPHPPNLTKSRALLCVVLCAHGRLPRLTVLQLVLFPSPLPQRPSCAVSLSFRSWNSCPEPALTLHVKLHLLHWVKVISLDKSSASSCCCCCCVRLRCSQLRSAGELFFERSARKFAWSGCGGKGVLKLSQQALRRRLAKKTCSSQTPARRPFLVCWLRSSTRAARGRWFLLCSLHSGHELFLH